MLVGGPETELSVLRISTTYHDDDDNVGPYKIG